MIGLYTWPIRRSSERPPTERGYASVTRSQTRSHKSLSGKRDSSKHQLRPAWRRRSLLSAALHESFLQASREIRASLIGHFAAKRKRLKSSLNRQGRRAEPRVVCCHGATGGVFLLARSHRANALGEARDFARSCPAMRDALLCCPRDDGLGFLEGRGGGLLIA